MPRNAMNYSNACVYKICCRSPHIEDVYVGSTTNLVNRRAAHKSSCNKISGRHYNFPVYQFIRQHGGWENWDVVKVESVNCNCSSDLHQRERYWVEKLGATLNSINPFLSTDERKEQKLACSKAYYAEHKEELNKKMAKYHVDNREVLLQKMKEYNEKNKQKLNEYYKMRYQKKREAILSRNKEKVTCEHCGSASTKGGIMAHYKSKKCRASRAN
jgi:hypothetical protein